MNRFELLSELFKNLGNPLRLKILYTLAEKKETVCNLAEIINENQPQVSRALAILKNSNLVICERKGNRVCYKLSSNEIIEILELANNLIKKQSIKIIETIKQEEQKWKK